VGGGEGAAEEGSVASWRACCKVRQAFMLEVSRPQMCFAVPEVVGKMISQMSATSQQGGWEIDGRAPTQFGPWNLFNQKVSRFSFKVLEISWHRYLSQTHICLLTAADASTSYFFGSSSSSFAGCLSRECACIARAACVR
jgi:hypothetical protein